MKKKIFIISVALFAVLSLLVFVAGGAKEEGGAKAPEKPESLTVLTMTGPWISGPVKVHGEEWTRKMHSICCSLRTSGWRIWSAGTT